MNNTIVIVNGQLGEYRCGKRLIQLVDYWVNNENGKVMKITELIPDNIWQFSNADIEVIVNLKDGERFHLGDNSYIQRIPAEYFTEWAEMGNSQSFPEYMEALLHYDVQDNQEN